MEQKITFEIKNNPLDEDINIIRYGLRAYNRKYWENVKNNSCVLYIRNEANKIIGGSVFYTFGNWLEIEYVWIEEEYRGKGIGKRLLLEMERIGKKEGCTKGFLNTYDFQAKPFYEKYGYKVVYTQENIPETNTRYFMEKELL